MWLCRRYSRGQVATEFMLVLPFAILFIITVVGVAILGVRVIVAQSAAMRAAHLVNTFQDEYAVSEFDSALASNIFSNGKFEIKSLGNGERLSNEEEGILEANAISNGALEIPYAKVVRRTSPVVPALSRGLSDRTLRDGDTPSPYCRIQGGYSACGFPE